ncbi:hypothetical protein CYY_002828 [Polysphondylium violaceum]|uniref:EGF-like domain-containing protein n=1 Tax=Polysphondylium violaceum TaxID=133409 RepID=A0A8J4V6H7_9MYCE|nr:hypothetical protein CYY_002828 [Polysphondylium violaceum]
MMRKSNYFVLLLVLNTILLGLVNSFTIQDLTDPKTNDKFADASGRCYNTYYVLLEDPDGISDIIFTETKTLLDNNSTHSLYKLSPVLSTGATSFSFQVENSLGAQTTFNIAYSCPTNPTDLEIEFLSDRVINTGFVISNLIAVFKVNNFPTSKPLPNTLVFTPTSGNIYYSSIGPYYFLVLSYSQSDDISAITSDYTFSISAGGPTYQQSLKSFATDVKALSFTHNISPMSQAFEIKSVFFFSELTGTFDKNEPANIMENSGGTWVQPMYVSGNYTKPILLSRYATLPNTNFESKIVNSDGVSSLGDYTITKINDPNPFAITNPLFEPTSDPIVYSISYTSNYQYSSPVTSDGVTFNLYHPFGYTNGDSNSYLAKFDVFVSRNIDHQISFTTTNTAFYVTPAPLDTVDSTPPKIVSIDYYLLPNTSTIVLTVHITDDISGFFAMIDAYSVVMGDYTNLVKGNLNDGIFEMIQEAPSELSQYYNAIKICDWALNCQSVDVIEVFNVNLAKLDLEFLNFNEIISIKFEKNDIDTTNQSVENKMMLYTTFGDRPHITLISFDKPGPFIPGQYRKFYGHWDDILNCYVYPFTIPKNRFTGTYIYSLNLDQSPTFSSHLSTIFGPDAEIRVTSENADMMGPEVTSVTKNPSTLTVNDGQDSSFEMEFRIKDSVNGLKMAHFSIMSELDLHRYNFTFYPSDAVDGDKYDGLYKFSVPVNGKCRSQKFHVQRVYLEDEAGVQSIYQRFETLDDYNPFIKIIDSLNYEIYTQVNCLAAQESDPPALIEFSFTPTTVDPHYSGTLLNDNDARVVVFNFKTSDDSGILLSALPVVYLQSQNLAPNTILRVDANLISSTDKTATYNCSIEIPYGFGFPHGIRVSLYGIIDNQSNFRGYSLSEMPFPNIISVPTTRNPAISLLSSTGEISTGVLTVFGRNFEQNDKLLIQDTRLNKLYVIEPTLLGDLLSFKKFENIPKINREYVLITIQRSTGVDTFEYSNSLKLYVGGTDPSSSGSSSESSNGNSNSEETPTNPPQKCISECSGNGVCTPNGCICKSPWVGRDCSSQVIIIEPTINSTSPSTNITLPPTSEKIYYAIISIVGMSELDPSGEVVNDYRFNRWIFTKNTNSKYQQFTNETWKYEASITSPLDQSITNVTVFIDYFNSPTAVNITFAGQVLTMNPYTLKYSVNVTSYSFAKSQNSLQLVLSASLENQEKNECSSLEKYDAVESNSEFIKLQVNDHSLYGRFIKRGIVDGRTLSISNTIVENKIYQSSSTQSKSQAYIGINLPYFRNLVQIDPDFSVLIDNKPANPSSMNSICQEKKSKLTGGQIAGIAVGSFAFASVIAVCIGYYIYKKKQSKKLMASIESRLKEVNK